MYRIVSVDDDQINSLPHANARFDASEKQPCLPGTRQVALDNIYRHLAESDRRFVWLRGSPGVGKSAISKTVCSELQRRKTLAASFFFDKRGGQGAAISVNLFVPTIARQLGTYSPEFRRALGKRLDEDPFLATAIPEVQLRRLLIEPLSDTPSPEEQWVVVVDALDECGERSDLKRLMASLQAFLSSQRTFHSSSPDARSLKSSWGHRRTI